MLPEIVYNFKKKLGYIFVENHNLESILLKRGLTTSCVVTQEKQGETPVECSDAIKSVTERTNNTETHIEGTSVGYEEKAGRRADSVQSIENRKFYEKKKKSISLFVKVFS